MKKAILLMGLVFLLTVGLVSAVENTDNGMLRNQEQVREMSVNVSKETGIPNAMLRVRNNETAQHLATVWAKIQAKDLEKLKNMTEVDVVDDGEKIQVKGVKEAKLLRLFKMNKTHTYVVNEDGSVSLTKRGTDFLYQMK